MPAGLPETILTSLRPPTDLTTRCINQMSLAMPKHLIESAWLEHAPFAFWLIDALAPNCVVELGTHNGFSYLAFCQAIERLQLPTECYAIDTWAGDEHAGFYGEDVFAELNATNEQHYARFGHLIRSLFDDALDRFPDRSIDLLHIDGRHRYEDVLHDFQTWRPKLSDRAVVLLHDTTVHEGDFGVWRLWEQIAHEFPSFEFEHGHGLGVLGLGKDVPQTLRPLFEANFRDRRTISNAYARLGSSVSAAYELGRLQPLAAQCEASRASEKSALEAAHAASLTATAAEDRIEQQEEALASIKAIANASIAESSRLAAMLAAAKRARDEAAGALDNLGVLSDGNPEANAQLRQLEGALADARLARDAIATSTFWRATAPLRNAATMIPKPARQRGRRMLRDTYFAGQNILSRIRHTPRSDAAYDRWVTECDTLSNQDRTLIKRHISALKYNPTISIIMPAYNTPEDLLRQAIASVQAQLYPHWELCVADDASPSASVASVLQQAAAADARIKWVRRDTNGHIAAASNTALDLASGDFVAFLDHDDLLPEHALYEVAVELNAHPETDLIYSDEDRIDNSGRRFQPLFKPDWSIDNLLGQNVFSHLGVYRRSLLQQIGGFREGVVDGSQDYDLALRSAAATDGSRVRHIPAVLYHWRMTDEASSFSQTQLDRCIEAGQRAVRDYLAATGAPDAEVMAAPAAPSWNRVRWPLPDPEPRVTLIVPTRDKPALLARCATGILHQTHYSNIELLIADNDSTDPQALSLLERLSRDARVRVLPCPGPFNFSAINNRAVHEATGEIIVLVNNDIAVIEGDWLREMVSHAVRPDVGAVGAKLLFGDGRIQHAGVVLGVGAPAVAGHFGFGARSDDGGYVGQLVLTRELSAVTGACLAMRKEVYETLGGLDETNLPVSFNDVDLCLRIRQAGLRVVWTPFAELYHLESASRGSDQTPDKIERARQERAYMRQRWAPILDHDPFYNANFDRQDHTFRLAIPTLRVKPWQRRQRKD